MQSASTSRLEELAAQRAARRREWEAAGGATGAHFRGTCADMCPEYERHEREAHLDVSVFERAGKADGAHAAIDHGRAVKKYHRSSAGNEVPLPEDVRPPSVLRRTMDYLLRGVLDARADESLAARHRFVRDRTRSIRQDVVLQLRAIMRDGDYNELLTIVRLHEEAARFHIASGHRLCEEAQAEFDPFQNTEQLRKVLTTLTELYVDTRRMFGDRAEMLSAEPEFRAYALLTHAEDPDVFRRALRFPAAVLEAPGVRLALAAVSALHQGDYVRFFGCVRAADYLAACLMHAHFRRVRLDAAARIAAAFAPREPIPGGDVARWLMLEDAAELRALCLAAGLSFLEDECAVVPAGPGGEDPASAGALLPRLSSAIEQKASGLSFSQIVLGDHSVRREAVSAEAKPSAGALPALAGMASHAAPARDSSERAVGTCAERIVREAAEGRAAAVVAAAALAAYRTRIVDAAADRALDRILADVARATAGRAVAQAMASAAAMHEAHRASVVEKATDAVLLGILRDIAAEFAMACIDAFNRRPASETSAVALRPKSADANSVPAVNHQEPALETAAVVLPTDSAVVNSVAAANDHESERCDQGDVSEASSETQSTTVDPGIAGFDSGVATPTPYVPLPAQASAVRTLKARLAAADAQPAAAELVALLRAEAAEHAALEQRLLAARRRF